MSLYRDSLPDEGTRARYDEAITGLAHTYVDACRERDVLAARHGSRAVAEAAWYPGHPLGTVDAIQARYEELRAGTASRSAA